MRERVVARTRGAGATGAGAPAPGRPPVEPGRGRGVVGACPLPGAPSAVRAGGSAPVRAAGGARAGRPGNRRPGTRRTDLWFWTAGGRRRSRGPGRGRRGGCRRGGDSTTGAGGDSTRGAGAGAISTGAAGLRTAPQRGGGHRSGAVPSATVRAGGWGLLAVFVAGGGSLASFSLRRRTTGASTVEEADRTNSPMSPNVVRTVLLSTPSSFASS